MHLPLSPVENENTVATKIKIILVLIFPVFLSLSDILIVLWDSVWNPFISILRTPFTISYGSDSILIRSAMLPLVQGEGDVGIGKQDATAWDQEH